MQQSVFLLSCLLLSFISAAPLTSDSDSSSSSEEDVQPPAGLPTVGVAFHKTPPTAHEAPPRFIVEVEDTKTNTTLSFAIFIVAEEEEESSGRDGRGRSDDNSSSSNSDDVIDDVTQPMASLPPTEGGSSRRPIRKESAEEKLSSEEMMGDQPAFSDEQVDRNQNLDPSLDFDALMMFRDDFNNSSETDGHKNHTRSDDLTNGSDSEESAELLGGFNNRTENKQRTRTSLDPASDEGTSSSSEKTSSVLGKGFWFGSRLQEVFRSIQEVVDLLSGKQEVMEAKGVHQEVLVSGSQTGSSLSSEESDESSESQQGTGSRGSTEQSTNSRGSTEQGTGSRGSTEQGTGSRGSTEQGTGSRGSTEQGTGSRGSTEQGTGSRGSTKQGTGPTTSSVSDVSGPDPDSKEVQDPSDKSVRVDNSVILNPVGPDQDVAPMIRSLLRGAESQQRSRSSSQVNVSLDSNSSDESDKNSESVSSDPKNQPSVGSGPDSDESLETSSSVQQGTGPTTSSVSDVSGPDPDSKEVQDPSDKSVRVDNSVILNPVGPDQDVAPQVNVSLDSDSSEESRESVVGLSPGPSRVGSAEVSSSSEEVQLVLASSSSPVLVSSPQTPTESGSLSAEQDVGSEPDPPGLKSLHPGPIRTAGSGLSPESNLNPSLGLSSSSEVSEEESLNIEAPTGANSDVSREANPTVDYTTNPASIAAISEASMDAKPDSGVKDTEADSSYDVIIEATSRPSMHGVSVDAKTEAVSELSVEEDDDDASTEATVSMTPTAEYRTPPDSAASTDANANIKREPTGSGVSADASNPGPNQHASSEENMASPLPPPPPPPHRKRPYRFGFLGPISHSHGNQHVAREAVAVSETLAVRNHQNVFQNRLRDSRHRAAEQRRHQLVSGPSGRVSVAAAANQSSSEENKK